MAEQASNTNPAPAGSSPQTGAQSNTQAPSQGTAPSVLNPGAATENESAPSVLNGGKNDGTAPAQGEASTAQSSEAGEKDKGTGTGTEKGVEGAPEKYEFNLPEGFELNEEQLNEISPVFKELKLTNEQAQKLVDLHIKETTRQHGAQLDAQKQMYVEWADEIKADKEIGGAKLNENLSYAKKLIDEFGSDEFKSLLEETGLAYNPDIIRFFAKAGRAMAEDKIINSGTSGIKEPQNFSDLGKIMFPNSLGGK